MTLLERAQAAHGVQSGAVHDKEKIELSLAWLKGEVTLGQIASALGKSRSGGATSCYLLLARSLRAAYATGLLKTVEGFDFQKHREETHELETPINLKEIVK
jgi:hypothetical protein